MNQRNGNDQRLPSPPPIGSGSSGEAARAIADWPLLAMLAAGRPGTTMSRDGEAIAPVETGPVFIPPASPPPAPVTPVISEPAQVAASELAPLPALEREAEAEAARVPDAAASPETEALPRPLSPLEQLFSRADKNSQAQPVKRTMFKQSGPPPLKTPGTSAVALADSAPRKGEAITIEPRPRQWHELETVPDRLFDRAGER